MAERSHQWVGPRYATIAGEAEPEWNVAYLFPRRGEWSEEEYLSLPSNRGFELVDGCLEILPMPSEAHQLILGFLYKALDAFVLARRLGLVLLAGIPVRVWTDRMREPDVVFMRTENAGRRKGRFWEGADLAMEIVSPDDPKRDWETKRDEYARAGIPEYWIIDPRRQLIVVLALEHGTYRVHGEFGPGNMAASALLPEFSVAVDEVFASAAPAGQED